GFGTPDGGPNAPVFAALPLSSGKVLIGGKFTKVDGVKRNCVAKLLSNGTVDPDFGNGMKLCTGVSPCVYTLAPFSPEKVLIGGRFDSVNGFDNMCVAVLNSDGSTDTNFVCKIEGKPSGELQHAYVFALLVEDNGILIGGRFQLVNGQSRENLARLHRDGTVDESFRCDIWDGPVRQILPMDSARFCVAGAFHTLAGFYRPVIAAVMRNGTVDTSFKHGRVGLAASTFAGVRKIVELPDGKVLAAGVFDTVQDFPVRAVARFYTDGSVDTNFVPELLPAEGWGPPQVYSVAFEPTGIITIGGYFKAVNGAGGYLQGIAQLLTNGKVHTNFASGLSGVVNDQNAPGRVYTVLRQPDGKILIGGQFAKVHGVGRRNLARLNPDGTLDQSFTPSVGEKWEWITSLAYQSRGRIIVGGYFSSVNGIPRTNLACLRLDGTLAPDFNVVPIFPEWDGITAIAVQQDDKILIGGSFSQVHDRQVAGIARLLPNGELDVSFEASGAYSDMNPGTVLAIEVQPDGKILVGGIFNKLNGTPRCSLGRLQPNGSLDSSFGQQLAGFRWLDTRGGYIYSIGVGSNNRILVGGDFHLANGTPACHLAKLFGVFHPIGPIKLGIELTPTNMVVLKWPTNLGPLSVIETAKIQGTNTLWTRAPGTPHVLETNYILTLPILTNRFFRLIGE
ncbi:MAG: delta-60 repeat domain-containing protein, partial [Verrucomicrobiae bacterium]|nr:delta-60 repeat domain-containing protein [Verrucomicrobiae bacterium]MDW7979107.1 delta-60 repeat domain-containing protein [Verrucomicrobiales bacterium]